MAAANTSLPITPGGLQAMATQAAIGAGIDPNLFKALVTQESGWRPDATSPVGAVGLTQLMPATAKGLGVTNISDPAQNLRAGAQYLAQQIKTFGGNIPKALAAYNAGPGAVMKFNGIPPYAETQNYVNTIMGNYKKSGPYQSTTPTTPATPPPSAPGAPGWGALSTPAQRGIALGNLLQTNLRRTLGGPNATLMNSMRQLGVPGSVIGAIGGSMPNLNIKMPAPEEQAAVHDQLTNFTASTSGPNVKVSANAAGAVQLAKDYLGTPYVWGGDSTKGFDCSGLLQYVWAKQGVPIPRTTYDQFKQGQKISTGSLRPGDAVFFKGSDSKVVDGQLLPGHVGMYIGDGQIIQAPHTGTTVQITPLKDMSGYMGARRYA